MNTLGYLFLLPGFILAHADDDGQTPALKPEEMYQDLFPLTNENFTENVFRMKDPWVVIFHEGAVERQWKTMAVQTRGLMWFGIVDVNKEKALIEHLEFDPSKGIARVYPCGNRLQKERNWKYVRTETVARSVALRSLPDIIQEVDGDSLDDVFTDAYMSKPTRFPAFLLIEEDETPSTFKALAVRFERYFLFSKMVRPTSEDLTALGLQGQSLSYPELYVIVTKGGKTDSFHAARFDSQKFGQMNYTHVMEFLFSVNSQFRHELPGVNMAHEQQEAEMADIVKIEGKRFEILYGEDGEKHVKEKPEQGTPYADENRIRFKVTKSTGYRDEL